MRSVEPDIGHGTVVEEDVNGVVLTDHLEGTGRAGDLTVGNTDPAERCKEAEWDKEEHGHPGIEAVQVRPDRLEPDTDTDENSSGNERNQQDQGQPDGRFWDDDVDQLRVAAQAPSFRAGVNRVGGLAFWVVTGEREKRSCLTTGGDGGEDPAACVGASREFRNGGVPVSQKVRIERVSFAGAPVFLGTDRSGAPVWSANPERVAEWLCDGWRARFNQHRALRPRRTYPLDAGCERWWTLFEEHPLGGDHVREPGTDKEARAQFAFLRSLPAFVLHSAEREENASWYAGLKRKKTRGGAISGFKKRRQDMSFVCYRNNGSTENALFTRTGRSSGVVSITGMNRAVDVKPGTRGCRWKLTVHVRVPKSMTIRPYTSVRVDWIHQTLVFVNTPLPIERVSTGAVVGIDAGVVHTLTTSDGAFLDMPGVPQGQAERSLKLQRDMARKDRVNKKRGGRRAMFASHRRERTRAELARMRAREARACEDWIHKTTTALVQGYDVIVLEDLNVQGMTRAAHGKGRAAKAGLNRGIQAGRWGRIREVLSYKCALAGVRLVVVNPAFTSQTCPQCGNVAKENRESQAVFHCAACGHEDNADINAARNILTRGLEEINKHAGQDHGLGRGGAVRPADTTVPVGSPRETSTPCTGVRAA